jgi:DNA-binding MarR family transcriptional regulator
MGTNQSDIAKACLMDRSGVSRAFKDFEEKGLITREIDEENKRAYKIHLTKKGIKTAEFLIEKEKEWDDMICEELNISRQDTLELLSKVSMKSLKFNREKF